VINSSVSGGFQNFHSNIDPEELFRKIFGNAGFQGGFSNFGDFAESNFGFAAATEVCSFWNRF
jgi:DnaJ family protein A protein 3